MAPIKPTQTPLAAWVMALSVTVTACGGGGSSTSSAPTPTSTATPSATPSATPTPAVTPSATPSATPTPAATPTPTPTPTTTTTLAAAECPFGNYKADVVSTINAIRSSPQVCGGVSYPAVGALSWDGQLESAASRHATDMAANNYWNTPNPHLGTDGTTLRQRVPDAGYNYAAAGENVAAGQTSVSDVFYLGGGNGWLSSAGHCAAMMTAAYVDVGASCKYNPASTYQYYWTLVMGKR